MSGFRTYRDPDVSRVTLTCVSALRGGGIVGDPVRAVRLYFDDDGQKVAEYDPATHDPVMLQEWFRGKGWVIDQGDKGVDDPFKEVVNR